MATQPINGISLYYEVHGTGEPLILISGLGGDHTLWQPSLPVLATLTIAQWSSHHNLRQKRYWDD